ncbi:MAG: UDP-3-O-(3-hydroxymyristoyl)glucosamine N-acyltransferase [Proteobacteria bacterium]|nr:UDP-3-O-(3-hydroxymyristoyl)glucosamine N-acyltransferase [Pseudomonadota bacterium]
MTRVASPRRLADLARDLGRECEGDGDFAIGGVAPLASAGAEDLSFARSAQFAAALRESKAGAVILPEGLDAGGRPAIRSPNPSLDFARAVTRLVPGAPPAAGIAAGALVAEDAQVHPTASIAAGAVVGAGAHVGPGSCLHPRVVLYPGVQVGADCMLHAGVVLREGTRLGDRVILQPGVVLGGDGFGYAMDEAGRLEKVPQVGCVVVEDEVEIGANTTVDRATLGETRIRRGAKIDNLVQIAHNCEIGEDAVVVAQSGLSGSTILERGAVLMAQSGSAGHLTVGERAFVGARAGLHKDVPAGQRVWGTPQQPEHAWHRAMAALARLPDALRRLRAVERKLGLRPQRPKPSEPS